MRPPSSWLGLLGTLALAGLPVPVGAQPVGSEFQINTYTTGHQITNVGGGAHQVAGDASGNFVVAWHSRDQDGSGDGVFGQRYDSGGVAQGDEFRVNSFTTNSQWTPSVAAAADGDFVVVWSSLQDGSYFGIFGQRYDSGGVPQGHEFRVSSDTTTFQRSPSVGSDASGNFVVVWHRHGQDTNSYYEIFGQRYDSGGVAQGDEFQINSHTTNQQRSPSVASDASGHFVVVWASNYQDGSRFGVFGQRYDSAGVAQGDEFRVNSYTASDQGSPSVASDASGNFVVVWNSQDGSDYGIFGQRYDSGGVAQGDEFRVNSYTTLSQRFPSVASDASGNFVVVWNSHNQGGSNYGIFGQRYDSAGVAQGDEFRVNAVDSSRRLYRRLPSVASDARGNFVVAWTISRDGSGYGVFGQRFDFSGDTVTVVSPNTNVKWRIGSVQMIKWTHNLGLNAPFGIELDRDDDGGYEERIAAEALADSPTRGSFAWTVTGPPSATARVRVSWTSDPSVSDASDETFQIRAGFTF